MFKFKHFLVRQDLCAMKVGTDGVLLGAWANGGDCILDVGTGTGLIALMMAQRYPNAQITAIDIDEGATRQALQNVENAGCQHRIKVLQEKVQAHEGLYDAIVSNPPFLATFERRWGTERGGSFRLSSAYGGRGYVCRLFPKSRVRHKDGGEKARPSFLAII